ncbi:Uncharacterised protein [uncultured archaeon]|nr:Uncharacterised protein [uncultured archaeon]
MQIFYDNARSSKACDLSAVFLSHIGPVVDLFAKIISAGHATPDHLIFVEQLHDLISMAAVAAEVLVLYQHHIDSILFVIGQNPFNAFWRDDIGLVAEYRRLAELAAYGAAAGGE